MARYQTAVGYAVDLSAGPIKDYMYCYGCRTGHKVPKNRGASIASSHAAGCRRVPGGARRTTKGGGVLGR